MIVAMHAVWHAIEGMFLGSMKMLFQESVAALSSMFRMKVFEDQG